MSDLTPLSRRVPVDGRHLWCDARGSRSDPAVVLVMGHGSQAVEWPDRFCDRLAAAGRYVVRFDNRDAGASDDATEPYSTHDMGADILGVCDALELGRVHVVGCSMGGVLAQFAVMASPSRFLTLTCLMSSATGDGLPGEQPIYARARVPAPGPSAAERVEYLMRIWRAMNGGILPFLDPQWQGLAEEVVERGWTLERVRRQLVAARSGMRDRPHQSRLRLPVLVLHGTADPVLPYPHGVAMAERTPGARLVTLPALGHLLHPLYLDRMADEIVAHTG